MGQPVGEMMSRKRLAALVVVLCACAMEVGAQSGRYARQRNPHIPRCGHGRHFFSDYMKCDASQHYCFEYKNSSCVGPDNWVCVHHINKNADNEHSLADGAIKNDGYGNTRCCGGQHQSPIDIPSDATCLRQLGHPYYVNPGLWLDGVYENTGYYSKFFMESEDYVQPLVLRGAPFTCSTFDNDRYVFSNIHIHAGISGKHGSAHFVDGKTYDGEFHLVHVHSTFYKRGKDGGHIDMRCASQTPLGLAVVGVFLSLTEGEPNEELNKLLSHSNLETIKKSHVKCDYEEMCDPDNFDDDNDNDNDMRNNLHGFAKSLLGDDDDDDGDYDDDDFSYIGGRRGFFGNDVYGFDDNDDFCEDVDSSSSEEDSSSREKDRDGDGEKDRDGDSKKDRDGDSKKDRDGDSKKDRDRDGEKDRDRDGEKDRDRDGEKDRDGDSKRDRDGDDDGDKKKVVCFCRKKFGYNELLMSYASRGEELQCRSHYKNGGSPPDQPRHPCNQHTNGAPCGDGFVDDFKFRPGLLLPRNTDYYQYFGSLTTPPCSEVVNWMMMKQPIRMTQAQLDNLHLLISRHGEEHISKYGDVRPIQPINDRTILSSSC